LQQQRQNKDLYKFPTERKKGVIATILFHIVILVILVISGFKTALPLPEEEGILVNFGYDQTGSGLLEPMAASSSQESSTETEEGVTDNVAEIIEEVTEAAEEIPEPEIENLTQDFEEAPVVEKEVEKPDPLEEARKKAEAEKIRQEQEAERIRKEQEAERIRQEEAERQRIEDSIRVAREQEQRRQAIMNRTRNALNKAEGTGTGKNQGVTEGEGNQGVETGAVGVNRYGERSGTGNEGVSFDLAGRNIVTEIKPNYEINEEGIVVVEITVDRNGNVTQAVPGVKGSNTLNEYFLRVAKEAALATKFDRKPDATIIQKGTITYFFKLR